MQINYIYKFGASSATINNYMQSRSLSKDKTDQNYGSGGSGESSNTAGLVIKYASYNGTAVFY